MVVGVVGVVCCWWGWGWCWGGVGWGMCAMCARACVAPHGCAGAGQARRPVAAAGWDSVLAPRPILPPVI